MSSKINILFICISLVCSSCYVFHNSTIREFKLCYDGSNTGIDNLININGYYEMEVKYLNDSSYKNQTILFYNNGLFLNNPPIQYIKKGNKDINNIGKYWDWGSYKISNDTIIGQVLYVDGATSSCESVYYKIIDSCTIQRIHPIERSNHHINETFEFRPRYYYNFNYSAAHFVPFDSLPNPDVSYAKSRKWFWCDKDEFKKWEKAQK